MKQLPFQMVTVKDAGLTVMEESSNRGGGKGVKFSALVWNNGRNKNHVLLHEDELAQFAASFVGQPFLADHSREQGKRGGTIVASDLVDLGNGRKGIKQTINAVKPWAAEGVLDGTVDRFSIGWNAEEYLCTVCAVDFFDVDHRHTPWDLGTKDRKTGKVVEVLMKGLEGVEVSAVTHPAVSETGVADVLQEMSAAPGRPTKEPTKPGIPLGAVNEKGEPMKETFQKFLVLLGLPADTAETEALAELEKRLVLPPPAVPATLLAALGLDQTSTVDQAVARAYTLVPREQLEAERAKLVERGAQDLVAKGKAAGKITPAMESWALDFARRNAAEFERCLETMPVQVTLSAAPPVSSDPPAKPSEEETEAMQAAGLTVEQWNRAKERVTAQRGKGGK